jgi:hypothetical protein
MEAKMVFIPVDELKWHIQDAIEELDSKKEAQLKEQKERETLYSINEVAKRLRRAHATIKRLVAQGVLRTTPDGLISEKAINDYLKNV